MRRPRKEHRTSTGFPQSCVTLFGQGVDKFVAVCYTRDIMRCFLFGSLNLGFGGVVTSTQRQHPTSRPIQDIPKVRTSDHAVGREPQDRHIDIDSEHVSDFN